MLRARPRVPPAKGGCGGVGVGESEPAGTLIAWVGVPACFSPCGRLFCKVRAARRGDGVRLCLWACGQRRLRPSGGVGRVSGALTRDLGPGQVGVSGPRCRKTDGRPLGSGPRCQGRACPWLEKAPPQPPTAGEAKAAACAGLGLEGRGCRLVDRKRTRTEGALAGGPGPVARAARLQGRAADPPMACGSGGRVVGCRGASGRRCWEWSPACGQGGWRRRR